MLQCLGDSVTVNGTVISSGNALSLTMQGSGCFASLAAVSLQKYRSFATLPAASESLVHAPPPNGRPVLSGPLLPGSRRPSESQLKPGGPRFEVRARLLGGG